MCSDLIFLKKTWWAHLISTRKLYSLLVNGHGQSTKIGVFANWQYTFSGWSGEFSKYLMFYRILVGVYHLHCLYVSLLFSSNFLNYSYFHIYYYHWLICRYSCAYLMLKLLCVLYLFPILRLSVYTCRVIFMHIYMSPTLVASPLQYILRSGVWQYHNDCPKPSTTICVFTLETYLVRDRCWNLHLINNVWAT